MANKVEIEIDVDVNNEEAINKLKGQLDDLEDSAGDVNVDVDVEDGELDSAKEKEEELNDTAELEIEVDDSAVQNAMQNISQGFATLKQGASEVGQVLTDTLASAGKQETNFKFLESGVGNAETARQKMEQINQVVKDLPGDDTVLQGLLSSAVAKDATLTADALSDMGSSAADYFAAMSYYGKNATEAQQDMTNYLLAGNTAELERSPILQGHIDKLKEATTVQERSQALAEALNEENWGGMSQQDTYNNKLETFNGMLERGKYTLGGMFQEGAKSAMDLALKLDDASGGLLGMGLAAVSFASPLSDMVVGAGQAAMGIKTLRDVYKDLTVMETIANAIEGEGAIAHIASALGITTEAAAADGAAVSFGGLAIAEGAALWPILAIISALALLGVAVYEVGKYFGWWTDVGSMIDAISAGVQRLWSAFINNPDVQSFIQGMKDAWASIGPALGWVISQVMSFFGISQGGNFDIVRALIMGIGAAWNSMKARIMLVITVVRTIISVFQQVLGAVTGFINNVVSKFTALPGQIQSAISGLTGIITAPFNAAWGVISPIIDAAKDGMEALNALNPFSGAEYAGFDSNVGYAGFSSGETLNNTLTNIASSSNSSSVVNNFNVHGIIEEDASQYIVDSMTNHLKKQNLIRGV